ncbi:microtubule-associated tumor suppressor 1 homolog isoform X2 [Lethenteron reissneri]|uniref:microtubule-associated tumor suppressor 1 homolog isoform X2 n=1 Tax=Lethenteron reissneri TaxID=7753 RepID=UPI002AB5EE35|nr:microtubule-associated tumor suppressor 1 homolog isoform X2 [Lethenteron reissneri]
MMQVGESALGNGQKGSLNERGDVKSQAEGLNSGGGRRYLSDAVLAQRRLDASRNSNPQRGTKDHDEAAPGGNVWISTDFARKATSALGDLNANSVAVRGGGGRVEACTGAEREARADGPPARFTNQVEGGTAMDVNNGGAYECANAKVSGQQADESSFVFGGQGGRVEEELGGAQPGCNSDSRGCHVDEEFSTYVTASVDDDQCPSQALSCKGESSDLDNQWNVDFDELPVDNDEQRKRARLELGHSLDVSTTGPNITMAADDATWSTDILNDSQETSAFVEMGSRCKQSHLVSDSDPVSSDCMDTTEAHSVSQSSSRQMRVPSVFHQEYLVQSVGGSGTGRLVGQRHGHWQISSDECDEGFSSINHSHGGVVVDEDVLGSSSDPEKYESGILCKSKDDCSEAKPSRAEDLLVLEPEGVLLNASSFLDHKTKMITRKVLTETTTGNSLGKLVGVVASEEVVQVAVGEERRANHAVDSLYEQKSEAAFVPDWATLEHESMERLNETKNTSPAFTAASDTKATPEIDANVDSLPGLDREVLGAAENRNPADQGTGDNIDNDKESMSAENTTLDTYDSSDVFLARDYLCGSSTDCVETSVSEISSSSEFDHSAAEPTMKSSRDAEPDVQRTAGTSTSGALAGETEGAVGLPRLAEGEAASLAFPKLRLKMPRAGNVLPEVGSPPALVRCEHRVESETRIEDQSFDVTSDLNTSGSLEVYGGILTRQGFLDIMSFDRNMFPSLRMEAPMEDMTASEPVFLTEVALEVESENGEIQTERPNAIEAGLNTNKVDSKTGSPIKKTPRRSMARLIARPSPKNAKSKVDGQAAHSARPLKRSASVVEPKVTRSLSFADCPPSSPASLNSPVPRGPPKVTTANGKPPRPADAMPPVAQRGGAGRPFPAPSAGGSHARAVRTLSFVSRIPGLRRASSGVRLSASISVKADSSMAEQTSEASFNSMESASETSRSAENSKKSLASSSSAATAPQARPPLAHRPEPGPRAVPGSARQASRTQAQARAGLSPPGARPKQNEIPMTSNLGGAAVGSARPAEAARFCGDATCNAAPGDVNRRKAPPPPTPSACASAGPSRTPAQPGTAASAGRPPRARAGSSLPAPAKSTSARCLPTAAAPPPWGTSRPSSATAPARAPGPQQSGPSRPLRSSAAGSRPPPATSAAAAAARPRSASSSSVGSNQSSASRVSNGSASLRSVTSRQSASPGRTPARTPTGPGTGTSTGTEPRPALPTQPRANATATAARDDAGNGDVKRLAVPTPRGRGSSASHHATPGRQRRVAEIGKERGGVARGGLRAARPPAVAETDASPPAAPDPTTELALAESERRALALAERCTLQARQLQRQLEGSAGNLRALDALAVVLQYTHAKHAEAVRKDRELSLVIHNVQEELASSAARCEALQRDKEELHDRWRREAERAEEEHALALCSLRDSLSLQHEAEHDALRREHLAALGELRVQHREQLEELQSNQESLAQEIEVRHSEEIYSLKEQQAKAQDELKRSHDSEKKALQEEFERTRLLLQDQVDTLTFQNDSLKDKARRFEEALQRDSAETVQAALAPYQYIQEEMASLQAVLEMRAHTIHQQQNRILELEKLDETNVALKEKVRVLTQQNEELKARVNKNSAMTRQLSFEHSTLQETLVKESKTNKRLSMENEELMWRLQNGEGLGSPGKGSPSSTSSSISFRFPPSRSPASMSPSRSIASPALSPTHGGGGGVPHGTPARVLVYPAPSPTHSLGTPVRSLSLASPSRGHASPARSPVSPSQAAVSAPSPARTPVSECATDVPR